jgi:hypothetical protein
VLLEHDDERPRGLFDRLVLILDALGHEVADRRRHVLEHVVPASTPDRARSVEGVRSNGSGGRSGMEEKGVVEGLEDRGGGGGSGEGSEGSAEGTRGIPTERRQDGSLGDERGKKFG